MILRILATILILGTLAFAQSERHEGSHCASSETGSTSYPCPMLQAHHEQMVDKLTKMDEKVAQLAQEMAQAQGDQKTRIMESLLTTLIEQRTSINEEIISMMPKMMSYVAVHSGGAEQTCSH